MNADNIIATLAISIGGSVSVNNGVYTITTQKQNRVVVNLIGPQLVSGQFFIKNVGRVGTFRCILQQKAIKTELDKLFESYQRQQQSTNYNIQEVYHGLT